MISFDNTEIAFGSKSDSDLNWSYRLFSLMGKPWLVKVGKGLTNFAFALRLPVKGLIKKTIFKQFCGGESIQDCDQKIAQLHAFKIGTILDYSVEGKESVADLEATKNEIIETIKKSKGNEAIPFAVFKVTGVSRFSLLEKANTGIENLTDTEKREYAEVLLRIDAICKSAHSLDTPLFIDAEDSWIQDAIDNIVDAMMAKYNKEKAIVYNTLQMYRHDRLAFLKRSYEKAKSGGYYLGVKLVRGAYMEKERERAKAKGYPSPIQPDKFSTDRDYNLAIEFMVEHLDHIAICAGTHNEESSALMARLLIEKQIHRNHSHAYFAQLLGMSDHISFNLAHEGFNVAKYVPYGPIKEVMPYLIRRAEENTSVAGQMGRELALIVAEKKRRKL
ncbi:MAG: proline dehydrogenase family protein [Putridiphycobacter sp.]|nr:proline dehydrogenase family protein [Putridiphycobacter sp.]